LTDVYIGTQSSVAQYMLGLCYYKGSGIEMNLNTAIKYWKKASFNGNECASYRLGKCYYYGLGMKVNYNLAFDHFRQAALKGHYGAFTSLDEFCSSKNVIDLSHAEEMLNQAGCRPGERFDFIFENVDWSFEMASIKNRIRHLETGCGGMLYLLGLCFYEGFFVPKNYSFAIKFWKQGDASGDSFATYKLGKCYYEGHGVEKSLKIAFELWSKISEVNPLAKVGLGVYFYKQKNASKAIEYWKETASCGFPKAISYLTTLKQEIPACSTDYLAFNSTDHIYSQYLCDVGGYNINDQEACFLAHACLKKTILPCFLYCDCLAYECDCYVPRDDFLFD
jgi:TPR repeat protein